MSLWIDTRLSQEEMDFLWGCISEENLVDNSKTLAGNISKSEKLVDKDNWFYESALKKHTEKMFYDDWNNYRKYHIVKEEPQLPKFELFSFWVNHQKQHEFNPIHCHDGLFSFVIFMKIPTHFEEQYALPISVNSNTPCASDFMFVRSEKDSEICSPVSFSLSPKDEGRMLFFPATLQHMVYPFYECEEERVTISGNIVLVHPQLLKERKVHRLYGDEIHKEREKILKIMEMNTKQMKKEWESEKKEYEQTKVTKKEIKQMKKVGENVE